MEHFYHQTQTLDISLVQHLFHKNIYTNGKLITYTNGTNDNRAEEADNSNSYLISLRLDMESRSWSSYTDGFVWECGAISM